MASMRSRSSGAPSREDESNPLGVFKALSLVILACLGIVGAAYGGLCFLASDTHWVQQVTQTALSESATPISFNLPRN